MAAIDELEEGLMCSVASGAMSEPYDESVSKPAFK